MSLFALLFPTMELSRVVGEGLVLWYGGIGVVEGAVSLGVVMAFFGYVRRFFAPLADLSQVYNTFQDAGAGLDRIKEYMDVEPEVQAADGQEKKIGKEDIKGRLTIENVKFSYDSTPVIQDLSLDIPAGEIFALVGATGAGKTTIVNLLTRLYDVDSGRIMIDGTDIRDIPNTVLRKTVSVVPQDVFLFDTTVRENIRYGRPGADDAEVETAARQLSAHEFISGLPEGYNTEVGEAGVRLSGGQKQLISLARAMLVDPRILILDEATSSVDAYTEVLIQRAMEKLLAGRTVLMIAHRFATLELADRAGVLQDGKLPETGSHEYLMENSVQYRTLYEAQMNK